MLSLAEEEYMSNSHRQYWPYLSPEHIIRWTDYQSDAIRRVEEENGEEEEEEEKEEEKEEKQGEKKEEGEKEKEEEEGEGRRGRGRGRI